MYLSYSGYKKYVDCPRAYYHAYVNKTVATKPDNRVGMLFGQTIGELFEDFYSEMLWKKPDCQKILTDRAASKLNKVMIKEAKTGVFDWKASAKYDYKCPEDILHDVLLSIPRGLNIIRQHRLIGLDAVPEVKLDTDINGHRLGGRADFIMRRVKPNDDRVILDGKGSKHREKYVDVSQLYWYSMLYRVHHSVLPDKVAFVFWRSEPDIAVDWHEVTAPAVDELQEKVLGVVSEIEATKKRLPVVMGNYEARPSESKCRFCSFSADCTEGEMILSTNRPSHSNLEGVEDI